MVKALTLIKRDIKCPSSRELGRVFLCLSALPIVSVLSGNLTRSKRVDHVYEESDHLHEEESQGAEVPQRYQTDLHIPHHPEGESYPQSVLPMRDDGDRGRLRRADPLSQHHHPELDVLIGVERVPLHDDLFRRHTVADEPAPEDLSSGDSLNLLRTKHATRDEDEIVSVGPPQEEALFEPSERLGIGLIDSPHPAAWNEENVHLFLRVFEWFALGSSALSVFERVFVYKNGDYVNRVACY